MQLKITYWKSIKKSVLDPLKCILFWTQRWGHWTPVSPFLPLSEASKLSMGEEKKQASAKSQLVLRRVLAQMIFVSICMTHWSAIAILEETSTNGKESIWPLSRSGRI